jgi:molybdopterin-containing oxidoreductase family membrane subunit
MEQNNLQETSKQLMPFLSTIKRKWFIYFGLLGGLVALGFYAFIKTEIEGHSITGMRDNVVWGVYIVNFIYLLGLSYAGAMISGIFHLARIKWGKPLIRIIEIFSFITLLIAPVYILLCIGRLDRLHYLFLYPRLQSPITWDIIAIMTDLVFCAVYLYMSFIKDFARFSNPTEGLEISERKRRWYKRLSFGFKGNEKQVYHINRAMDIMAAIIIPTAIIAYSLLAWLFGMNLKVGWNSSILAPYFVLAAIFSGLALLIVIIWVVRKIYPIKEIITDRYFYILGYGLLILSFIYGYFAFSDYITIWYNSELATEMLFDKLSNEFGTMYLISLLFTFGFPILFIGLPWLRKPSTITLSAVMILIAMYLNRYLLIVPVLESPSIPINNPDPLWVSYIPTWIEWSLSIAGVAFGIMLFMLFLKWVPIIPLSEMEEKKRPLKLFGKITF